MNQLQANNDGVFEGLSTPKSHQSNLLNQLMANNDGTFEGLSTPSSHQSNLLRQLKANHSGIYKGWQRDGYGDSGSILKKTCTIIGIFE